MQTIFLDGLRGKLYAKVIICCAGRIGQASADLLRLKPCASAEIQILPRYISSSVGSRRNLLSAGRSIRSLVAEATAFAENSNEAGYCGRLHAL